MKLKKSLISLAIGIPIVFFSALPVVSCSNSSIEDKLASLLNDKNLFTVELDETAIKESYGFVEGEKIPVLDLFSISDSFLRIINSQKLNDWNSSLSEEDKLLFTVDVTPSKLKAVVLPSVSNLTENETKQIDKLDLVFDVSTANVDNKQITISLDLSKYDFLDLNVAKNLNNFTEIQASSIPGHEGTLLRPFYENYKEFLKTKTFDFSGENTISGKFDTLDDNVISAYIKSQNDLYYLFDKVDGNEAYFYIYTNNSQLDSASSIRQNTLWIKIPFELSELNQGGNA